MNKLVRNLRYAWPAYFVLFLTNWLPDNVFFMRLRGWLIGPFLGSCGSNLRIGRNITLYNPHNIHFGCDVFIAYGCWFGGGGKITIGDEVMLGPYIIVSAGNHMRMNGSYRFGPTEYLTIHIGNGSWIGAHTTLLGGSSIGKGCMVGSNACVTRGIYPDNSFIVGVPAVIKNVISGKHA